jgi:putative peptidoglycan lipid II flippase
MRRGWRARLAALVTREYSIPEASAVFMGAFLLSASLGVVRQVLFNAQFGAGYEASAFYAAFRLPDTLTSLIAGGTLSNALIPALASTAREEGPIAEWELACQVLTVFTAIFAVITLIGMIFTPWFISSVLAPGFDAPTSELTVALTRLMLGQSLLGVAQSVLLAYLNSRHQFTLSVISIVVYNFTIIGGILAARYIPGLGVYGPAIGVVGDALLQLLILVPGLRLNRVRLRLSWDLRSRGLREVFRLMIPNGLSGFVNYIGAIADTSYTSLVANGAAIPALQNASLLYNVPTRLLGVAIGQAAFPRLARYAAAEEWQRMRRTLLRAFGAAVLLALPVIGVLIGFGREIVRVLFERGRFDASAATLTYTLMSAYIVALPAYIGTEIVTRGLIALHDTTTPLLTNCGQMIGRVLLLMWLVEPLGALAIPVAFAISSTIEMLALSGILVIKLRRVSVEALKR